jgi:hypothetical protein
VFGRLPVGYPAQKRTADSFLADGLLGDTLLIDDLNPELLDPMLGLLPNVRGDWCSRGCNRSRG